MALQVPGLCVQEDEKKKKKITQAIIIFWCLREAARERKQVLPSWPSAKASLMDAKEYLISSQKPQEHKSQSPIPLLRVSSLF